MTDDNALERRLDRLGIRRDDEWVDRYLLCDHLVDPQLRRGLGAFRGGRPILSRLDRPSVGEDARDAGTRQSEAHLLPVDGVPDRPDAEQQHPEHGGRSAIERALRREGWDLAELLEQEPDAGLATAGSAAWPPVSSTRWRPSSIRRWDTGSATSTGSSASRFATASRWRSRTTGCGGRIRGRSPRPGKGYAVSLARQRSSSRLRDPHPPDRSSTIWGVAYDRPVAGYGARCVNTLRLWAAMAPASFDFTEFSHGDFVGAVIQNVVRSR